MKRAGSILIVFVFLCTCLVSCNIAGEKSYTVSFSDGSSEQITAADLLELSKTNGRRLEEIDEISGKGKITKVGFVEAVNWKDGETKVPSLWEFEFTIDNKITVRYVKDTREEPDFYVGDEVEFCGSVFVEYQVNVVVSVHFQFDTDYLRIAK